MFYQASAKSIGLILLLVVCHPAFGQDKNSSKITAKSNSANKFWHHWRGPHGNGVASEAKPPTSWSEKENVRWKTKLPGRGHSTPIVTDKLVFLTTAIPIGEKFAPRKSGRPGAHDNSPVEQKHQFVVIAIQRSTGKIKWQTKVNELIPHEGGHVTASLASASCVTDGKTVFAHFGSFGTYALDFEGKILWKKQLGKMHSKHGHGEGASPVLHGDRLFINWDEQGQSFVAAFSKKDGKQIWRVNRDEVTSWSSPIVIQHGKKIQLVVNGSNRVRAYDPENGKVIWECGGLSQNICASPVFLDGYLIAGSSYEKRGMIGVPVAEAKGDMTRSAKVWRHQHLTPYVPSLLAYDGQVYFLRHYQGIVSRLETKTGKESAKPVRLQGFWEIYASPVAAAGKIFITDRQGTTVVLNHKKWPQVLSVNQIDDRVNASLALVGNEIYIRGEKFLYCIAESSNSNK